MRPKKISYYAIFTIFLLPIAFETMAQSGSILVTPDGHVLIGAGRSLIFADPVAPPASNTAPVARNVSVRGQNAHGQRLTVSFTYADAENDPQGATSYQWYRADDAAGTNSSPISGEKSSSYVVTTADLGKYLTAGVRPVASSGVSNGVEVKAAYRRPVTSNNTAPLASNATIQGMNRIGQLLTISFEYTDADDDPEDAADYQWYRADDGAGTNSSAIDGAKSNSYVLTMADLDKYLTAGVTPVASSGISPGLEVKANYFGPVTATNTAPEAHDVTVTGTLAVGRMLSVSFTYVDAQNDPQGAETYQWYRAGNAAGTNSSAINGATSDTYVLTSADKGKYITAGVTPVAASGETTGVEARLTPYGGPVVAGFTCGSPLTVTHAIDGVSPVGGTINYGTVHTSLSGESKCWITQNLGAQHQASGATDASAASAGWYWQFNRKQGYKYDSATRTPNTAWASAGTETSDWFPDNDPCTLLLGSAWRLPTISEWAAVDRNGGNWSSYTSAYASELKLHAAGYLFYLSGGLTTRGTAGLFWSSTVNTASTGQYYYTDGSNANTENSNKANGYSVRCLRD